MANCSRCGKKLGFWSTTHKLEDGSIICSSCFEKRKSEQAKKAREHVQKNRNTMLGYIRKYISNKNMQLNPNIVALHKNEDLNALFDEDALQGATEHFQASLHEVESSMKSGLSSHEIDEIISTAKTCEQILDFLEDLEKMYKLFHKKGIKTDYFEILSLFARIIENNLNKEYDKVVLPFHKRITKRLGYRVNRERVIREFMKIPLDIDSPTYAALVSRLLRKFKIRCKQGEVEQLIERIRDEMDLDEFERDLGSSQKIEIGDFTKLKGYEFEEYLKNLFRVLGYTVIKTPLSGDQGADLIISKDNERIVVQAKKSNQKVSNRAIQEIVAAKSHYKADKAIVVTNSSFTKSAINLALSNDVELWDGTKLKDIIKNLKTKKKGKTFLGFGKSITLEKEGKQKIELSCPVCEEEFDYDVDIRKEGVNFKVECPHCGSGSTFTISLTKRKRKNTKELVIKEKNNTAPSSKLKKRRKTS